MKILDRDMISEFFRTWGWFLLILSLIYFIDTMLGLFEDIAKSDNNVFGWALLYYVFRLPNFVVETAVLTVSTSILWVITRKARSMELMAYMAGGISPMRIALPFLGCAALVTIGILALNEFIRIEADRRSEWIEEVHIKEKDPDSLYNNRYIHRRGSENLFYFVDEHNSITNVMTNPTIIDLDSDTHLPRMILRAEVGTLANAPDPDVPELRDEEGADANVWLFERGSIRRFDKNNQLILLDTFERTDSKNLGVEMDTGIQTYLADNTDPRDLTFTELQRLITLTEKQNKPVNILKLELYSKIALPLAVLLVAMVICSHVISPKSMGILAGFGGGLLWIAGYYILFLSVQRFELLAYEMPPFLLAAIPGIVYGGAGIFILWKRNNTA